MDNWFQSKWFIRVLALAFAITLFIFVNVESNSTQSESSIPGRNSQIQTLEDVPVDIKIDSDNYVVSGVPEFATVSLEGSPALLMPMISNRSFSVFVDLNGLEEGEHTVELEHNITGNISVYIEPKTINISIEERASEEFPITVDFLNTDKLPAGYEVGDYELNQSTVMITTSRSLMEQIGVVRVYVDVEGLDSAIRNREVPINVYDSQGNELNVRMDRETVVISAEILNPSKTVPISIDTNGELPEGFSLLATSANLDEVEIFAISEVLNGIESISTEPIDLSEITESGTIEVGLALPEGVITEEVETIEVTVQVEETRTIEAMAIEEEGLAEGQEVTFLTPDSGEMELTVTGNQSLISELNKDDFQISVDLANLEPGEHSIPISINWDKLDDVTVNAEFDEVTVTIEEPQAE
ncbi:YbbR-like domain-containing protein [Oceanobacillus sp. FSL H7-0719]|uniref:CdaR family protein n=1 Tax=Oceanobacillus sp. FSL H7-0719 TaxID=2954507 RepID=UPI003246E1BB